MPSVSELIAALPADEAGEKETRAAPESPLGGRSREPLTCRIPLGFMHRSGLLTSLQAKIFAGYLFYWLRGWLQGAAEREKLRVETEWKTAVRVLDSMEYLRGAVMKVGQALASYPDLAPEAVVKTLQCLHANARPMHWALLKEQVHNELGGPAEQLFAALDKRACAAASLGQVHRGRLPSGEEVAVKIQYPGIARTIRRDLRCLLPALLPARFSRDWQNAKAQLADLRARLEEETDYLREAGLLNMARSLFGEDDGIVVPKVHGAYSTCRVLTMDYLRGMTIDEFLASGPAQADRNEVGRKIFRCWYRLMYRARMFYADFHPGNFLVHADGRLGLIDFGYIMLIDDDTWEQFRISDRALTTGRRDDRIAAVKAWSWSCDGPADAKRIELSEQFADWSWRARYDGGEFDFSDEADFRHGTELLAQMARHRFNRGRPCTPTICRAQMAMRALLFRLQAKVDVREIAESEIAAAGWDRSDYVAAE